MAEVEGAKAVSLAFRIAALGLSVAAAVVMGTASQLLADSGGRVVSYSDYGALVYFVAASVISAVCTALALYLSVHDGAGSLAVSLLDAAAQALLFSAAGAALAVRGVVASAAVLFCGKVGIAAAIGACAAAAVSVAAVTKDAARGSFSVSFRAANGSAASGSACKHGC